MQVNFIHMSFTKEKQMAGTNFKEFREVKLYRVQKEEKSEVFRKSISDNRTARETDPSIRLFHLLAVECGVRCLICLCLFAYSFNL